MHLAGLDPGALGAVEVVARAVAREHGDALAEHAEHLEAEPRRPLEQQRAGARRTRRAGPSIETRALARSACRVCRESRERRQQRARAAGRRGASGGGAPGTRDGVRQPSESARARSSGREEAGRADARRHGRPSSRRSRLVLLAELAAARPSRGSSVSASS